MSNKAVLISIRPKWVNLIASGQKTIEVRKVRPKIDTPFKCYIYQTLPKSGDWNEQDGRVIGEFVCDNVEEYHYGTDFNEKLVHMSFRLSAVMTPKELFKYAGKNTVYGWHITNLKIYNKPKKLEEFWKPQCERVSDCGCCPKFDGTNMACSRILIITRPPQSYCFVEELTE